MRSRRSPRFCPHGAPARSFPALVGAVCPPVRCAARFDLVARYPPGRGFRSRTATTPPERAPGACRRKDGLFRAKDFCERSALGQFIDQFVQIADLLRQRILDVFDAVAANRARNPMRVGM